MQLHTGTYSSIQLHTSLVSVSIKTFQPPKHNKSTRSIRHHVIFHIKWLGTGLLESARSGRCLIQTSSCKPFGMRDQSCHSCCRFSNASQNMFLEKNNKKRCRSWNMDRSASKPVHRDQTQNIKTPNCGNSFWILAGMAWKALLAYILAVGANGLGSLSLGSWFWTSLRDEICGRAWRSTTQHPEQRLSAKVSAFIVRPASPQKKTLQGVDLWFMHKWSKMKWHAGSMTHTQTQARGKTTTKPCIYKHNHLNTLASRGTLWERRTSSNMCMPPPSPGWTASACWVFPPRTAPWQERQCAQVHCWSPGNSGHGPWRPPPMVQTRRWMCWDGDGLRWMYWIDVQTSTTTGIAHA